jgi:hypothetical protein
MIFSVAELELIAATFEGMELEFGLSANGWELLDKVKALIVEEKANPKEN